MQILYSLLHREVLRYNELKRAIKSLLKSLTRALKELESDGLIIEYLVIPPKVEYKLSEKGQTKVMKILCKLGNENK